MKSTVNTRQRYKENTQLFDVITFEVTKKIHLEVKNETCDTELTIFNKLSI